MPSRSARRATGVASAATLSFCAAATLFPHRAPAISYEWKSAINGTWASTSSWSRTDGTTVTGTPTAGDSASFNLPSPYSVTFTTTAASDVVNLTAGAVTFASTGGQKNLNLTSGLAQLNLSAATLNLGTSSGAMTLNTPNLTLSSGATLLSKFASDILTTNLRVGVTASPDPSTLTVDGFGSTLNVTATGALVGANSATGNLNILNQSSASFGGALTVGDATSSGSLTVQSAASMISGSLSLAASSTAATGAATLVVDASSALTLTNASTFTVGSASGPASTATVNNSTFTTGTGLSTVNPSASLSVTGSSTFNLNGDLLLAGAASFSQNSLVWTPSKTITVASAGSLTLSNAYTTPASSTLHLAGGSLTINPVSAGDDTTLTLGPASSLDVTNGGHLTPHALSVGTTGTNSLTVDGVGSTLDATGSSYPSTIGSGTATGTLILRNGSLATFDNTLSVAATGTTTAGTLNIQSGATCFAAALSLGTASAGSATVNVTGAGSALILSGPLTAGSTSSSSTITVSSGATLTQGDTTTAPTGVPIGQGATQISRGATLAINGGFVSLGTLLADPATISLSAGSLGFVGNLPIDPTGPLGYSLTLGPSQSLALTGNTTVGVGATLALAGGSLSTASLSNNGTLTFSSGTLALTGNAGLSVSSAGPLGASPNLSAGKSLIVSQTTTLASTASLSITGGSLTTDNLTNNGSITVNNYGSLTINSTLTNASTGRLFIGPDLTALADGPATNAGRITLQGGATRLVGASPLTNTGLITGDGELAKPLVNSAAGELRADTGKLLLVSGPALTNSGKLNLTGGTIEFSDLLTNAASVIGHGTLIVDAGMDNYAQMSFSAGDTNIYGPVSNYNKVLVTGAATVTFYDPLSNAAGADIYTAANSASVFVAPVTGPGTFSGPGTKYFSDGSSTTAALESSGITVIAEPASLTTADFVEQSVTVNGSLTTTSPTKPSQTPSLTIGPTGSLDLTASSLILTTPTSAPAGLVASATTSPALTIRQYLLAHQLFSSSSDPTHTLGYVPTGTSTLIKLTLIGDANLDGQLNADDFALLDKGYRTNASTWWLGDFNYDGTVTPADYLLLDSAYLSTHTPTATFLSERESQFGTSYVAALLASIPEPASLLLAALSALPALSRRRRLISVARSRAVC